MELDQLADVGYPPQQLKHMAADRRLMRIGHHHAQGVRDESQRGGSGDADALAVDLHQLGLLAVELVLDLADDLLEYVPQADEADDGPVLVDHERDVLVFAAQLAQQLVDQHRLRDAGERTGDLSQLGLAQADLRGQQVLDVHQPNRRVEAFLRLAEWEAGQSGLERACRDVANALAGRDGLDLWPRDHDLARAAVAEGEDVLGQPALLHVDQPSRRALAEQVAEFVLRVGQMACVARRGHAERLEQQVSHCVEQIHDWPRGQIEQTHWRRHQTRRRHGPRDGEALRRELTDDDVEQGND